MQKLTFKQLVLTGFVATIGCVFILGISSYLSISDLQNSEKRVSQTEKILVQTHDVYQHLLDAESSERGYILTDKKDFISRYNYSASLVRPTVDRLRQQVSDNPVQVKNSFR